MFKIAVWLKWLLVNFIIVGLMLPVAAPAADGSIYVVPLKGTIEEGLGAFVQRSIDKAYTDGARAVLLEIDTPGGSIEAAIAMKDAILKAKIPVIAYVDGSAASAGALITLASNKVAMTPGSIVGAAEPRPAEEKIIAYWRSEMEGAADARGRDPQIAAAMVDKDVQLDSIKPKGKILSLSANKAMELGVADMIVRDRAELLQKMGYQQLPVVEVKPGPAETLARWITHPAISSLLLTIGIGGLLLEALTIGWGVAGTIGLIALGFFFGGNMLAGYSGWEAVLVFLLGIIALVLEVFLIPGFGIAGILGILMVGGSIFLASPTTTDAVISLTVAILGSIIILALGLRFMTKRHIWSKLALGTRMVKQDGYIAPPAGLEKLMGAEGLSISPLRPAGTVDFAGNRVDVVSEGGFIEAEKQVKVVMVEGTRVVVKEIKEDKE